MQEIVVILVLLLYVAFSFNPLTDVTLFSRTLFLSPGELLSALLVGLLFFKALIVRRKEAETERTESVRRFLLAFVLLAMLFFLSTLLFFMLHNELTEYFLRSFLWYARWIIALVLFYYGSESMLRFKDVRLVVWMLAAAFIVAVVYNMNSGASAFSMANILVSQYSRLEGQFPDPNQLGEMAAFFTVLSLFGALYEKTYKAKILFMFFAGCTAFILALTQSRESFLTLLLAVAVTLLFLMRDRSYFKVLIVLSGLVGGAAYIAVSIPRIADTLTAVDVGNSAYALNARDQTWRVAWETILGNPLGIGFENLSYLTGDVYWQAHNGFLQSAVVAGYPGLITYLGFLGLLFQMLREQKKRFASNWMLEAYLAFFVGYVATSMVSDHFITFYTFNAVFFGLLGLVTRTNKI